MNEKKNKHMTLEDRLEIQECLTRGMRFKAIAARIGKSITTVSREVQHHAQTHTNNFTKTDEYCSALLKAPYVCNGCPKRSRSSCTYTRRLYLAKVAQKEYETLLVLFKEEHPSTNVIEMDTVIGRVGGKAIMTFQFVNVDFMFGILLENKSAAEVGARIIELKEKLALHGFSFGAHFPVLLTDNGGEFSRAKKKRPFSSVILALLSKNLMLKTTTHFLQYCS